MQEKSGGTVPSIVNRVGTNEEPPTYNKLNKFTIGFQTLVDSYGVARYREVNPGIPSHFRINLLCPYFIHVTLFLKCTSIICIFCNSPLSEHFSALYDHHVSVPLRGDVRRCGSRATHVPFRALDGSSREEARRAARNG